MPATVTGASQLIEDRLAQYLRNLERVLTADCLAYFGPIVFGVDDAIRDAVEGIERKRGKLVFVLETVGGYAETARRIADVLRYHYGMIDFLVPGIAMSAGTILVMSGDAIHMDYYSVLGPIDPQIGSDDGKPVPALGYLIRYNELLEKANHGEISTAEMEILVSFDQTRLYAYEQARDLSIALLKEWLVKYKFKDWNQTETKKTPVTSEMKEARAQQIANALNDTRRWNSHGIGINMEILRRDLNLRIDDFGRDVPLNRAVRQYYRLLQDYMGKMGHTSALHTRQSYTPLIY